MARFNNAEAVMAAIVSQTETMLFSPAGLSNRRTASIIPAGQQHRRSTPMKFKVLLPSDGSPASLHAARHVARNLEGLDAKVLLLNVQRVYVDAEMLHMRRSILDLHHGEGEAALREAAEILAASGIEYQAQVGFGPVADMIVHTAQGAQCDAIVMGTRARHPLVELLARSVPSRVLRRSRVPVMLVRHDASTPARRSALRDAPYIAA
jgi:nucleotide-binding universal stress UspA family protein